MKIKFDSPSSVHISYETTEEELLIHWLSIYRPVINPNMVLLLVGKVIASG